MSEEDTIEASASNAVGDLFRRHLATTMRNLHVWRDGAAAANYGDELIGRLPTLARSHNSARRINRAETGDKRRTTTLKVRFTALDRPTYQSTAGVNMEMLLSKGLGRRDDTTCNVGLSGTVATLKEIAMGLFPIFVQIPFDLLIGKKGNRLERLPLEQELADIKRGLSKGGFARIWVLPEVYIEAPINVEQDNSQPANNVTPTLTAEQDNSQPANNLTPTPTAEQDNSQPANNVTPTPTAEQDNSQTANNVTPTPTEEQDNSQRANNVTPTTTAEQDNSQPANNETPTPTAEQNNAQTPLADEVTDDGYMATGTPTVSFRRPRTVLDVTNAIPIGQSDAAALDEYLPVVSTSQPMRIAEISATFRERLKDHTSMFISGAADDPFLMEVRRGHVLGDAIALLRVSQEDLHSSLSIRFVGEDGVDLGGLRREFWSLLLHQVTHSALVTGDPGQLTFQKNFLEREKNTYYHLGQLTALSILQDGPGLPIFADCVVGEILGHQQSGINPEDLPGHLKGVIRQMNEANADVKDLFLAILDDAMAAGFLIPCTSFTRQHIPMLEAALVNNMVSGCRDELNQFVEGLRTHQVLDVLRQEESAIALLSGHTRPVTAAAVRNLLNIKYRDGNIGEKDREVGQAFLAFIQASKGTSATVNNIRLSPMDILMWMTGSSTIPAVGFHKAIDVDFGPACRVNTCALVVTLAELPTTVTDPIKYFTELVINSQTFQRQ